MELQCKERVELLEALRDSRKEASENGSKDARASTGAQSSEMAGSSKSKEGSGFIGHGTIPAVNYPDLARPGPPLPQRPVPTLANSSANSLPRPDIGVRSSSAASIKPLSPNPGPVILPKTSRTPSPDKRSKMKTTLRPSKDNKRGKPKEPTSKKPQLVSSKAAGLAWDSTPSYTIPSTSGSAQEQSLAGASASVNVLSFARHPGRDSMSDGIDSHRTSQDSLRRGAAVTSPSLLQFSEDTSGPGSNAEPPPKVSHDYLANSSAPLAAGVSDNSGSQINKNGSLPSRTTAGQSSGVIRGSLPKPPEFPSYRSEYPAPKSVSQASIAAAVNPPRSSAGTGSSPVSARHPSPPPPRSRVPPPPPVHRRPVGTASSPKLSKPEKHAGPLRGSSDSAEDIASGRDSNKKTAQTRRKKQVRKDSDEGSTDEHSGRDSPEGSLESDNWEERLAYVKKHLPKGVDPWAARQIFNEIVVKGDEVHWSDVAGLDQAKTALKEAVVYPFLRPDLFMGLREPARGMLLFGPPGTGKTMLARAVATESRSTFFAISASSLTSKWLGESEKLVRALFALARALAPSIIFVDEIDSLLSSRGGSSEHESTRRIKTEFLIQWSDLQRAAAGKEQSDKEKKEGDASRVLVLAATNLPWAIDEAARRRFVRRQYIPLPEPPVREEQLQTLISHQKHSLSRNDIQVLVEVTDGE